MTKKDLVSINNQVINKYSVYNCYLHCLVLKGLLESEGVESSILYNSNHCVLLVDLDEDSEVFYADKYGVLADIESYRGGDYIPIELFGKNIVLRLLDVNLGM